MSCSFTPTSPCCSVGKGPPPTRVVCEANQFNVVSGWIEVFFFQLTYALTTPMMLLQSLSKRHGDEDADRVRERLSYFINATVKKKLT